MGVNLEHVMDPTTGGDSPQKARMRRVRMRLIQSDPYLGALAASLRLEQLPDANGIMAVNLNNGKLLFSGNFVDQFDTDDKLLDYFRSMIRVGECSDAFADETKKAAARAAGR